MVVESIPYVHDGVMYHSLIPLVGITTVMLCLFAFAAVEGSS